MPVIAVNNSLLTITTVENVLAGSQWEFLPFNAHLAFGFCASAVGLIVDAFSGQDVLCESMVPLIKGTSPIFPDDFVLEDVAGAGERIKVRIRNVSGGTLTVFTTVRITPI